MIEETAIVVSVQDGLAEVETLRRSACGSCSAKTGCGSALFASVFGNRRTHLQVANPVQAEPGDHVVIGLSEKPFMRAAFALYSVPLLTMIGGALFAEWLVLDSAFANRELAGTLGGLLGLVAGFVWLARFSRRVGADPAYQAVILRRVGSGRMSVKFP